MEHMGHLSTLPRFDPATTAQQSSIVSYFPPVPFDTTIKPVLINESRNVVGSGHNVGLRTWEAALRLAYYLHLHPDVIGARNILELGAGTGMLSIFCASNLNAKHVMATDGLGHVVQGMQDNIELNVDAGLFPESTTSSVPLARDLDWRASEEALDSTLKIVAGLTAYDVVLGADITYAPDMLHPLIKMLDTLENRFPGIRIIISATTRNPETLALFETTCEELGFEIEDLDQKGIPAYQAQRGFFHEIALPIRIMGITRKTTK